MATPPYPDDAPRQLRIAILCEAQNGRCCYCGELFCDDIPENIRLYRDPRPSIEHVRRLADGGQREWSNEVAACRGCNSARGTMDPEAFRALVGAGDVEAMRRALRSNPKRRTHMERAISRRTGPSHVVAARRGGGWPAVIGELVMTPARAAYFKLVYGPWRAADQEDRD